ncbi:GyrI-like domain-containing protein [Winogradskyella wichelsiae]|uniref:GyrI-like domain-containing protein n=1 Tax=Winogradskyella wichelsiae TaxID=2697007 RepID=UPI003EFB0B60
MYPRIIKCKAKRVVGISTKMTKEQYFKITQLWQEFMPIKKEINNINPKEFIAVQQFPKETTIENIVDYTIWACVEVSHFKDIPKGMSSFVIPAGEYAVFLQKGMDASKTYQSIMTQWLPKSGYAIDNRPHFQIMGETYKNGSPDSEEDFYIPIQSIV